MGGTTDLTAHELDGSPRKDLDSPDGTPLSRKHKRLYAAVGVVISLWLALTVWAVTTGLPSTIYWFSYYAVDYSYGFVRRGLGGTISALFGQRHYFLVSAVLTWGSVVAYFGALALLARKILSGGRRSERRMMVALLVPVLPFTATFALYGPRPELYGAAALILFSLALTRVTSTRAAAFAAAAYGAVIMVLTLIHEAIPQEFTLGAILAIAVLGPAMKAGYRWLCIGLALGPAALTAGAVMAFGHRDLADRLCAQIPHHLMRNSYQVPADKVLDYAFGRYQSVSDYHDWVCSYVIPYFGASFPAAIRSVTDLGIPVLIAGFLHGLAVCIATIWLVRFFTGVPIAEFTDSIRIHKVVPALALAAMIPVFATGADWIRWWTIILINIATVYLVFAASRPEMQRPVTRRDLRAFVATVVVLILVPLTAPAGYSSRWADGYTWTPQTGWTKTH